MNALLRLLRAGDVHPRYERRLRSRRRREARSTLPTSAQISRVMLKIAAWTLRRARITTKRLIGA